MHNIEDVELTRAARRLPRVGPVARNLGLMGAGVAVALLAARSVMAPLPPAACAVSTVPAAVSTVPAAVSTDGVALPSSLEVPEAACPAAVMPAPSAPSVAAAAPVAAPEAAVSAPVVPSVSSPDGHRVIDEGFPAISADGEEVAMMIRRKTGEIEVGIYGTRKQEMVDAVFLVVASGPGIEPPADGVKPEQRLLDGIAHAKQRLAGFVAMPGTEIGLTRDEVRAMPARATMLHAGELTVYHRGPVVSVRRTAAPAEVVLDWVAPELDPSGPCAPFAAAAHTAKQLLVLRFEHARCSDRDSRIQMLPLGAPEAEPVAQGAAAPTVDLATGQIYGLPAVSPDGSTVAMDGFLLGNYYPSCEVNLRKASDGALIRTLRTSPDGEDCGEDKAPSEARRAMLAAVGKQLASWRTLRPVSVATVDGDLWFRQGTRLWMRGFSPADYTPPRDGDDCSVPPRPAGFDAWHVAGDRVLIIGGYMTGGCMCDRQAQQIEVVPGFGAAAQRR